MLDTKHTLTFSEPIRQYAALPIPDGTPNPLQLWGGVYEVFPNGHAAVALTYTEEQANTLVHLLNAKAVVELLERLSTRGKG